MLPKVIEVPVEKPVEKPKPKVVKKKKVKKVVKKPKVVVPEPKEPTMIDKVEKIIKKEAAKPVKPEVQEEEEEETEEEDECEVQADGQGVTLTMLDGSLLSLDNQIESQQRFEHLSKQTVGFLTMIDGSMRPIYDEDGDGVEDNVKKTHDELEKFFDPAVYGTATDLYNTKHGNLPGHVRKSENQEAP